MVVIAVEVVQLASCVVAHHLHDRFPSGQLDDGNHRMPVLRREALWAFSAKTQC